MSLAFVEISRPPFGGNTINCDLRTAQSGAADTERDGSTTIASISTPPQPDRPRDHILSEPAID